MDPPWHPPEASTRTEQAGKEVTMETEPPTCDLRERRTGGDSDEEGEKTEDEGISWNMERRERSDEDIPAERADRSDNRQVPPTDNTNDSEEEEPSLEDWTQDDGRLKATVSAHRSSVFPDEDRAKRGAKAQRLSRTNDKTRDKERNGKQPKLTARIEEEWKRPGGRDTQNDGGGT